MMAARQKSYFELAFCHSEMDNNSAAREAAKMIGPGDILGEKCWETRHCDVSSEIVCITNDGGFHFVNVKHLWNFFAE